MGLYMAAELLLVLVVPLAAAAARADPAASAGTAGWAWRSPVDYPLRFLAIGDWGRAGPDNPTGYNQTVTAAAMARRAAKDAGGKPHFTIGVGDSFYDNGLASWQDPRFSQRFTNIYNQTSLQVPWYNILGNHCYGDGYQDCPAGTVTTSAAILDPRLRTRRDWRWHAFRNQKLSFLGGKVEFFLWDTNPAKNDYSYTCWAKYPAGILKQDWVANLNWLSTELKRSRAQWKIVVGHHAPYSSGRHGNNREVRYPLESLIRKHGVQAYFAGHDHDMEHLHVYDSYSPNYHVIVTGGGSKRYTSGFGVYNGVPSDDYPTSSYSVWGALTDGFVACTLTRDELAVEFYSLDHAAGEAPVHVARIPRVLPPAPVT